MSQRLYKRAARLVVSRPIAGQFFGTGANQITISDLRIGFDIQRTLTKEPNSSKVSVYNLAANTGADIQLKPLRVRLDVGYDGQFARVFDGDVKYVEPPRLDSDGVTTVTELYLGDGDRSYQFARIKTSLAPNATVRTALVKLADAAGLQLPPATLALPELEKRYRGGLALYGPVHVELTRVLRAAGLEWSVQDGRLQVLPRGAHRNETAIVISQDTGMVGQPTYGGPPDKGKPPTLKVTSRIDPSRPVVPGGLIQVEAENIKGTFKVQRASLHGDTEGDDWNVDIEATAKK